MTLTSVLTTRDNAIKLIATKQSGHVVISLKNNERDIHPLVCIDENNKVMYYGRIVQDLIRDLQ